MAAKDSKTVKKMVDLGPTLTGKVSIDRKQWEESKEDNKRSDAILGDIGLDILLGSIIEGSFQQRTKEVERLINSINMIQKARLAYILGLIDKTVLNDLEQIHEIRNKFSHSFEASFAHTKVLKFVRKLSTAKGQEVTEKNSDKFYESAGAKCVDHIMAVFDKQELKKAQKS
jgi:hypothetical protein